MARPQNLDGIRLLFGHISLLQLVSQHRYTLPQPITLQGSHVYSYILNGLHGPRYPAGSPLIKFGLLRDPK